MSFEKNIKQVISFEYDFAKDGGAQSTIAMRAEAVNRLRPGLVVTEVYAKVITALAGTATGVTIGSAADPDGFVANIKATAAGEEVKGGGALISDGTWVVPGSPVNGPKVTTEPVIDIAGGALTAGKVKVDFHCYMP